MTFGIQGKVALLVIVATAASSLLVSQILTRRAAEVLREHEIVDLGDEASLKGWTLNDQIEGLKDDLNKIAISRDFQESIDGNRPPEEIKTLARTLCRRNWENHLRIDVVTLGAATGAPPQIIHEKAILNKADLWFPDADAKAGERLHLSPIQRVRITRKENPGETALEKWEPVIWAVAPLDRIDPTNPRFIRILMTLDAPVSSRHLLAIANADGSLLVRHDETESIEVGNDEVFLAMGKDPLLLKTLNERIAARENPEKTIAEPRIDKLLRHENLPLKSPYYFLEGSPGKSTSAAIDLLSSEEAEALLKTLQSKVGLLGRVGGMQAGVREVRVLAHNRVDIAAISKIVESELKKHFVADYDGIDWRNLIKCEKIHSWTVRLLVGGGKAQSAYYIHYAVLDEELASSIEYEMLSVQYYALIVAGGFGIVGFFIAMFFIRPLKLMTRTAQKIIESRRENLIQQIAGLAKSLDIKRRDEVGDIARASKRIFEELISFQEELEQRVNDRTRELRRTNIEFEKANEKLKSLSHEKDAFVAKVSHDLRQPLNAIFLQVEALKLSNLDEMQKKDVQRIRDHAARELNLVNDILEYQKIIMGAETLNKDTIDIRHLLDDLVAIYGKSVGERPVTLSYDCPEDIGEIIADDRRIRQILGNLVGNACKFTFSGSISLAARPQEINGDLWVEFTVTDTGRGMNPGEQSKAFVPFVSNKKDNAGGSGLGLSICRELVAQMGGKIGFVSELGKGTHFSVFIPRLPTSEYYNRQESSSFSNVIQPATITAAFPDGNVPKGTTILVIDDDAKVRDLLGRILTNAGHRVITAEDGNSGLLLAEKYRPDAITLDVVMPGGKDGWDVLRALKESPVTHSIPVIMVSVMAEQENALTLEVEDYLVKPIDVERLGRVITRVTQHAPQRNLLLVDDDVASLEAMSRILEAAGWHTITARDGIEALAVLTKTRPAAIVLDLIMPEMDGFEFLEHLRDDQHLRSIPVIVMSGKDPTDAEQAFLRARVSTVLKKGSHTAEDLLASIKARIRPEKRE